MMNPKIMVQADDSAEPAVLPEVTQGDTESSRDAGDPCVRKAEVQMSHNQNRGR